MTGWKVHARDKSGRAICGAKNTASTKHEICHRSPCSPNGRCRNHGGLTPAVGSNLKHGKFSEHLRSSVLSEAYAASIQDRNLLDMREPIALLEACLKRTTERAADADAPGFRRRAVAKYEQVREFLKAGNQAGASQALTELGTILRDGVAEDRALEEVAIHADRLAKRLEGAWAIKLQRKQVLNIQQVGILIARLQEIIREEADPLVAAKIMARSQREVLMLPDRFEEQGESVARLVTI